MERGFFFINTRANCLSLNILSCQRCSRSRSPAIFLSAVSSFRRVMAAHRTCGSVQLSCYSQVSARRFPHSAGRPRRFVWKLLGWFAGRRVIIGASPVHAGAWPFGFRPRSENLVSVWTASPGSVNAFHLTRRAVDKWDSARFLGMFLARSWFRFEGESTLRPLAANAGR